jgi:uncharacterized protein YraI
VTSKKYVLLCITSLALFVNSCGVQVKEAATPTTYIITPTIHPTLTPAPTETPLPPPPKPTIVPMEGMSSTQINVRAEPSTVGTVLGIIPPNTKVEIVGKDPAGNWWQIRYPHAQAVDGKGWVTAQYVTTAGTPEVPVVGSDVVNPENGNVAIVQQQINIRSGPGTSFNSLGTLNPQDVVRLTGKDANGAWLQIAFTAGPDGKGWVNAGFVQAKGVEDLPIVTEAGEVIGTGTPTGIPSTPIPTVVPAWADNDSMNKPVVSVTFERTGTHSFTYTGDISSPNGDSQDWINFTPYGQIVLMSLECNGVKAIQASLLVNGLTVENELMCGDRMEEIPVNAGSSYFVHLQIMPSTSGLQYINYTITIQVGQ